MPLHLSSTLTFVTSNAGKLREAEHWLGFPLEGAALELDELQTTDLPRLVRHKAEQAYGRIKRPLLVGDAALIFSAWGELPGPFIKYFLSGMGAAGLVRALQPFDDHGAEAVCLIGYHDGSEVRLFEGRVKGRIVPPRGEHGFGWDPIFQPGHPENPAGSTAKDPANDARRTFAEMPLEEKQRFSMRALALQALAEHLGHR